MAHIFYSTGLSAEGSIDVKASHKTNDPYMVTAEIAKKLGNSWIHDLRSASLSEKCRIAKLIRAAINREIFVVSNELMTDGSTGLVRHVSDVDLKLVEKERVALGVGNLAMLSGRDHELSIAKIPCMSRIAFGHFETFEREVESDLEADRVERQNRAREEARSHEREAVWRTELPQTPLLHRVVPPLGLYDWRQRFTPTEPKRRALARFSSRFCSS